MAESTAYFDKDETTTRADFEVTGIHVGRKARLAELTTREPVGVPAG